MQKIKLYNAHCCGEIGDVVIGLDELNFKSPKEGSEALLKDKSWRIPNPLDLQLMKNASKHLIGKHDFTAFFFK